MESPQTAWRAAVVKRIEAGSAPGDGAVYVTVPHRCLVNVVDPGCDERSWENAQTISAVLRERLVDGRNRVELLVSETPRYVCDNNRDVCRGRTSLRRALTARMVEDAQQNRPFTVVDVHGFSHGRDFRLDRNAQVVLLDTARGPLTQRAAAAMRRRGLDVASFPEVVGSEVNSIQREARERGGDGLLVEIREDLPSALIQQHVAQALADALGGGGK